MRKKIIGLFVVACCGATLLIPTFGLGQQGGGKKGGAGGKKGGNQPDMQGIQQLLQGQFGAGGKKGGAGGFDMNAIKAGRQTGGMGAFGGGFDAGMIFDMLAKGQDSIMIESAGQLKIPLQQWAMDNGNTSGRINRQQFSSFGQTYLQGMQAGAFGGAGAKGKGKGTDQTAAAQTRFKSLDKNGDGYLNDDERTSQNLKTVWKAYDKNGDSLLAFEEYLPLYLDSVGGGQQGGKGNPAINAAMMFIEEEWDKRPTVYKVGKLPKELPIWFVQLDNDKDAQIGLYEWKLSGKQFYEFQVMDRNGDGLITTEEVLWHLKSLAALANPNGVDSLYPGGLGFGQLPGAFGKKGGPGGGKGGNPGGGGKKGGGGGPGGKKGGGNNQNQWDNFDPNGGWPPPGGGPGGKKGGGKGGKKGGD